MGAEFRLHPILALQKGIGNQAVSRLLRSHRQDSSAIVIPGAAYRYRADPVPVSETGWGRIQAAEAGSRPSNVDLSPVINAQNPAGTRSDVQRQAGAETDSENWHTVKAGESLSLIAKDVYGDLTKWPAIFEANRNLVKNENLIEVGWRLFIPPLDVAASLADQAMKGMDKVTENFGFAGQCRLDPVDWLPIDHENFRLRPGRSASAAVNAIFSRGTAMDCACALWATLAYSVLNTVGPDRFDRAMGQAGENNQNLVLGKRVARADEGLLQQLVDKPMPTSINDLLPGDAVYFKNTEDIHNKHPGSPWQGENTIYKGNGLFSGHGVGTKSAPEILEILAEEYNKPPTPTEKASPDYRWTYQWDRVTASEIPGIQWQGVMRLHAESVELL